MNKQRDLDTDNLINPDFATSTYYAKPSMTENELRLILERDNTIHQKFMRNGYIISKEFPFITRCTFDKKIISELDYRYNGEKTSEQKDQAIKMCKIVEDYLNELSTERYVKVAFASRSDSECALYDESRFKYNEINIKLINAFT